MSDKSQSTTKGSNVVFWVVAWGLAAVAIGGLVWNRAPTSDTSEAELATLEAEPQPTAQAEAESSPVP